MLRAIVLLTAVILGVSRLEAQKEANHFGFTDFELDFTSGQAEVQRRFAPHQNRGMGLISDKGGNLLFYTDGYTAFNRSHQAMSNGSSLIPLTGYSKTQESIIIPKPGSDKIFYIFTTDPFNGQASSGFFYSEVDLSLNNGLGDVTTKGVKLTSKISSKLSACLHSNGKDVWVMTHKAGSNAFVIVLITDQGVTLPVKEQSIGMVDLNIGGEMKFSPDGKRLASSHSSPESGLVIFNFDAATGVLSNPMEFSSRVKPALAGNLEFSSDATKLYMTETGHPYLTVGQLDLSLPDTESVRSSLHVLQPSFIYAGTEEIQLAPDGKIYGTKGGGQAYGNLFLSVIENPNDDADEVILKENGLHLKGGDSFVGATPNFVQNYLYQTSFRFSGNCENSTISFQITNDHQVDSVTWDFGNGTSSKSRITSTVYMTSGTYTVKLDVFHAGVKKTISRQITIDPVTSFELGENRTVCDGTVISIEDTFDEYEWNTGAHSNTIKAHETQWYKLTIKNQFGCTYADSLFLTVKSLPTIALPDSLTLSGEDLTLDAGDFQRYAWNNDETTRKITVGKTGWYSVLVEDETQCKNAKSVFVYRPNELSEKSNPKWKWLNPTPSGLVGRDICFVNDSIGFVINAEVLMGTANGGGSWRVVMRMPSAKRIIFRDSIGYIIGDKGLIYKSTHLGTGWNRLNAGITADLISLSVIDKDTLRVASSNQVFSSDDGGRTWKSNLVSNVTITDLYFTSGKTGHVVGNNGIIRKTIDGGKAWYTTMTSNVIPSDFFRVTFVNKNLGFASREHSELYRTTDGGETWKKTSYNLDAAYSIHFVNQNLGFVAGEHGAIHKTTDGGTSWNWVGFAGRIWANDINSIFFVNEKQGYATGVRGRIIRTNDGGVSWEEYSITYNLISQIDFLSPTSGYALLWDSILRTTNGGKSWVKTATPAATYISSIDFVTSETGYAAVGGGPGYVYEMHKTSDGGKTWQLQSSSQLGDIKMIHFIDEQTGFAASGATFKTINGGQTWNTVSSVGFGEIQFVSALVGYARNVGSYYNRIYKTIDGGNSWSVLFEIDDDITALHFLTETDGYFVGDASLMYKTTDGGINWKKITAPYVYYIDVAFVTKDLGYILDDYGNLYQTSNGGTTWTNDFRLSGLRKIQITEHNVYLHGDFGAILVSEVGLNQMITIGPLSATEITRSGATLSSSVKSKIAFESMSVTFDIGRHPGVYDRVYDVAVLNGVIDSSVSLKLSDLQSDTKYYCRFKVTAGESTLSSNELTFHTITDIAGITIGPLLVSEITESQGNIQTFVESDTSIESLTIFLEVGRKSGVYDMQYSATPLQGTSDQLSFDLTNLTPGTTYYCRLKLTSDTQTLYSDELIFETQMVTNIRENSHADLMVYPSPTTGPVNIDCHGWNGLITYELSGTRGEVYSRGTIQQMSTIDLSFVSPGIYVLKLTHGAQQVVKRIIKK